VLLEAASRNRVFTAVFYADMVLGTGIVVMRCVPGKLWSSVSTNEMDLRHTIREARAEVLEVSVKRRRVDSDRCGGDEAEDKISAPAGPRAVKTQGSGRDDRWRLRRNGHGDAMPQPIEIVATKDARPLSGGGGALDSRFVVRVELGGFG
jgi:hypothetical protein